MEVIALRRYLKNVVSDGDRLCNMQSPTDEDSASWTVYLERQLGLLAVPTSDASERLWGYPLWFAQHASEGPVLLKCVPSLLGADRIQGFLLEKGVPFECDFPNENLTNLCVLFEPFSNSSPMTFRVIVDFVLKPSRGLLRQAMGYQLLASLAGSVLFIANYSVLAYIVPEQNYGAYWAMAWLIAGSTVSIMLSQMLLQRAKLYLDSLTEERAEILKLSLLWSLRPHFISTYGMERVQQDCALIAQAGRAAAEISFAMIALLALLPVLVLMYLRLPGILFFTILAIAVAATIPQVLFQWRQNSQRHRLTYLKTETAGYLCRMMANLARLNFYGATGKAISRWTHAQEEIANRQLGMAISENAALEANATLADLAKILAIFVLSILVATSTQNGQPMTVAAAFIVIHLVSRTYALFPSLAAAVSKLGNVLMNLGSVTELVEEAANVRKLNEPKVTQATASIECHRVRLPHGCRFKGAESLTLRLEGPRVVSIAGDSGAGKTTFLNCVLGIQAPEAGSIEVYGVDPMRLSTVERQRIFAYADQNIQLLPGTVRDNLKLFGGPSSNDRNLWEVLERVFMLEPVQALPLGLDTPITDAHRNFSTGERQRMALAQCIAKESTILVLDEAMSGLPMEMEEKIFSNIRPLFEQVYFVSHRIHMHGLADTVIKLEARQ